ncbi:MAG: hypothetical protein ACRD8O_05515 [Bryobacteraceae bacterium]
MTITVEINAETEARLAAEAEARGLDVATYAARLLEQAQVPPAPATPKLTIEEFHAWLDDFAALSGKIPPMPGETFSREMIYQDHD